MTTETIFISCGTNSVLLPQSDAELASSLLAIKRAAEAAGKICSFSEETQRLIDRGLAAGVRPVELPVSES